MCGRRFTSTWRSWQHDNQDRSQRRVCVDGPPAAAGARVNSSSLCPALHAAGLPVDVRLPGAAKSVDEDDSGARSRQPRDHVAQLPSRRASHDRATNSRSLQEIQARGFWKQSSSVHRYEKHARLGLQISTIRSASRPRVYQLAALYDVGLEKLFEPHFVRRGVVESSSKYSRVLGTSLVHCG